MNEETFNYELLYTTAQHFSTERDDYAEPRLLREAADWLSNTKYTTLVASSFNYHDGDDGAYVTLTIVVE